MARAERLLSRGGIRYLRFLIPPGARVIEIGCGTGDLLARLEPSRGDISRAMIAAARAAYPELEFRHADAVAADAFDGIEGPFDVILIVDTIGYLDDIQALFDRLHLLCKRETRLVVGYFSHLWWPALKLAEVMGLRVTVPQANVLSGADVRSLAELSDFEVVKSEARLLSPARLFGLGRFVNRFLAPVNRFLAPVNRFLAPFPVVRQLALRQLLAPHRVGRAESKPHDGTIVTNKVNEMWGTDMTQTMKAGPMSSSPWNTPIRKSSAFMPRVRPNKLARTFAAQVEALKRYRSGGEQTVRIEYVTVNDGGQAIVGNVTHGGRGLSAKTEPTS